MRRVLASDRERLISFRLWIFATVLLGLVAGVLVKWL